MKHGIIAGHDRIAQLLVNNEADVQIRDSSNSRKTALEWAKTKGKIPSKL